MKPLEETYCFTCSVEHVVVRTVPIASQHSSTKKHQERLLVYDVFGNGPAPLVVPSQPLLLQWPGIVQHLNAQK